MKKNEWDYVITTPPQPHDWNVDNSMGLWVVRLFPWAAARLMQYRRGWDKLIVVRQGQAGISSAKVVSLPANVPTSRIVFQPAIGVFQSQPPTGVFQSQPPTGNWIFEG